VPTTCHTSSDAAQAESIETNRDCRSPSDGPPLPGECGTAGNAEVPWREGEPIPKAPGDRRTPQPGGARRVRLQPMPTQCAARTSRDHRSRLHPDTEFSGAFSFAPASWSAEFQFGPRGRGLVLCRTGVRRSNGHGHPGTRSCATKNESGNPVPDPHIPRTPIQALDGRSAAVLPLCGQRIRCLRLLLCVWKSTPQARAGSAALQGFSYFLAGSRSVAVVKTRDKPCSFRAFWQGWVYFLRS
jgi:hypothetical protein